MLLLRHNLVKLGYQAIARPKAPPPGLPQKASFDINSNFNIDYSIKIINPNVAKPYRTTGAFNDFWRVVSKFGLLIYPHTTTPPQQTFSLLHCLCVDRCMPLACFLVILTQS